MDANERFEVNTDTEMIRGFGRFLVALAAFLTVATVRKLANIFNYRPATIEECERDKNPGYVFVMSLRERGIINPNNVSLLLDALREIELYGIAFEVMTLFETHCQRRVNHKPPNEEQLTTFIKSIKITYQELCNRVQPIPFIRDRLLSVDNVFIDSGMERLMQKGVNQTWQRLESYHCLFRDPRPAPMRCILYGEPGFGKSTLALQLVYDWCNSCPQSPLRNVDVLIFLKLREIQGVTSIMKAIKQFVLPRDSNISERDIVEILYSCKSVVILLDGLDEYAYKSAEDGDDISSIIKGRMFQTFFVVVTTRSSYKPVEMASTSFQVRLTGFDSGAQDKYIRKTLTRKRLTVKKIKRIIEENPIVRDLCEVPLFFAMSSYMIYMNAISMKFGSVTTFFRYMIGSFHEHMKSKLDYNSLKRYEQSDKNHESLNKAAFEALTGENQKIVWMKEKLLEQIGYDLYDLYREIGILVEEEVVFYNEAPGSPTSALTERKTYTRFYHKLFCEWFAAQYLSKYFMRILTPNFYQTKIQLDPFELQYVFRFACGINPSASPRILEYLQTIEGGDQFAILCVMEQTGKVESILESIQQLCFEGVVISGHDSLLLQRSSLQLLEIAARYHISIRFVLLHNCFESVEQSMSSFRTTSGLTLTLKIPVQKLRVQVYNREMTEDEAIAILTVSSKCSSLKQLGFGGSVPPQSFKVDATLSTLKSRKVKVWWRMFKDDPLYILNLDTGRWENKEDGNEPAITEFEEMRSKFVDVLKVITDDFSKGQVENIRKQLREEAQQRQKKD